MKTEMRVKCQIKWGYIERVCPDKKLPLFQMMNGHGNTEIFESTKERATEKVDTTREGARSGTKRLRSCFRLFCFGLILTEGNAILIERWLSLPGNDLRRHVNDSTNAPVTAAESSPRERIKEEQPWRFEQFVQSNARPACSVCLHIKQG